MDPYRRASYGKTAVTLFKAIGIIFLSLAVIMITVTACVGIYSYSSYQNYKNISENGKHTLAQVTKCAEESHIKTSVNGKVTYYYKADISYIVGDKSYEVKDITITDRERAIGEVEIYYLSDAPDKPVTEYGSGTELVAIIVCAVVGGVGLIFLVISIAFLVVAHKKKKSLTEAGEYYTAPYPPYPQYPQYPQENYHDPNNQL